MSSQFTDAVIASITAGMDPQAQMLNDFASKKMEVMDSEIIASKQATIKSIAADIADFSEKTPKSVRDAYDKLLERATKVKS